VLRCIMTGRGIRDGEVVLRHGCGVSAITPVGSRWGMLRRRWKNRYATHGPAVGHVKRRYKSSRREKIIIEKGRESGVQPQKS